jgi:hypothetical protein
MASFSPVKRVESQGAGSKAAIEVGVEQPIVWGVGA